LGDPLEIAFLESVGLDRVREIRRAEHRIATVPFDADRKRMTTVHQRDGRYVVATKGAPEMVVDLCVAGFGEGGEHPLDREGVGSAAAALAAEGFRVVALARRDIASFDAASDVERDLVLVALMALEDPVRKEAAGAVAEARAAGVRIVMVTGDHPATATTVARKIGLADEPLTVLTGAEIRATGVPSDPSSVAVYARVDPDQKLEIVRRLQDRGHVVGVTGDGVNDAPALRRADIGVALGRSGTDVAREAGDLVITDDNLSTIVSAIREGRGIYANIRKVVDYLLACNASEVLTVLFVLVFFPQAGIPLLPLQLLWMNLVTDGLPALALGVDPTDSSVMSVPPRDRSDRLLDGAAVVRLGSRAVVLALTAVSTLVFVRYVLDLSWSNARAATFTVLVWTQLLHVFSARRIGGSVVTRISPLRLIASIRANRRLAAAVGLGALLQAAIVLWRPAGQLFGVRPFTAAQWMAVTVASAVGALLVAALPSFSGRRRTAEAGPP
jgi:Ca2+-transporting ATPase